MTSPYKNFKEFAATQLDQGDPGAETGFFANLEAGFEQTRLTGLSISEMAATGNVDYDTAKRNRQLGDMISDGAFPSSMVDKYGDPSQPSSTLVHWEAYANYAKDELGYADIMTHEDLQAQAVVNTKEQLEEISPVIGLQNTAGFWGEMAGMTGAYFTDPVTALTVLFTPAAAVRSATILGAGVRTAIVGGVSVGVEESIRQPFVQSWRKDLGMEYGWAPALQDIMFATLGGTAISGVAGASFKALQKVFGRAPTDPVLAQTLNDMNAAPDPNMPAAQHMDNIDTAVKKLDEIAPGLNLSGVIEDVDPAYALARETEVPPEIRESMDELDAEVQFFETKEKQLDAYLACIGKA